MTDSFSQEASDGTMLTATTMNGLAQKWAAYQNPAIWSGLTRGAQATIINAYWAYLKADERAGLGT